MEKKVTVKNGCLTVKVPLVQELPQHEVKKLHVRNNRRETLTGLSARNKSISTWMN